VTNKVWELNKNKIAENFGRKKAPLFRAGLGSEEVAIHALGYVDIAHHRVAVYITGYCTCIRQRPTFNFLTSPCIRVNVADKRDNKDFDQFHFDSFKVKRNPLAGVLIT